MAVSHSSSKKSSEPVKATANTWIFPLVLLLIAAFVRFYSLGSLPFGFHNDEVMNGYVGRFTLQNGQDLYGNRWPVLYFNNFGDYPPIIPMYLSGLFTYFLGVNEFAVRFPIALAGVFTISVVYSLGRWMFREHWVALCAGGLIALLPLHIILSRATAEGVTAGCVFLMAYGLVLWSSDQKKMTFLGLGSILLLGTYLLYPSFRILTPLSLLPLLFINKEKTLRFATVGLVLVAFALTAGISSTTWGKGRFEQTSVFSNDVIKGKSLQYSTGIGENQVLQARIFHNKLVLAGREVGRQYLSYFSPQFWVGIENKPLRYKVIEHGAGYFSLLVIIALAVVAQFTRPLSSAELEQIFHNGKAKYFGCLIWVLLLSPLPAALTTDDAPNVHRAALIGVMMPFLFAAAAAVTYKVLPISWKKLFLGVLICSVVGEFIYFAHYYVKLTATDTTIHRSEEQRTLAKWLIENKQKYQTIYAPGMGALPVHYLFFSKNFDKQLAGKFQQGLFIDQVENIHFVTETCPLKPTFTLPPVQKNDVVVMRSECTLPPSYKEVDRIKYSNLTDAYLIAAPK